MSDDDEIQVLTEIERAGAQFVNRLLVIFMLGRDR